MISLTLLLGVVVVRACIAPLESVCIVVSPCLVNEFSRAISMAMSSVCSVDAVFETLQLSLMEVETTAAAAAGILESREPSV